MIYELFPVYTKKNKKYLPIKLALGRKGSLCYNKHGSSIQQKGVDNLQNHYKKMKKITVVALWILIWQIITELAKESISFASPLQTVLVLFKEIVTLEFWMTIFKSFGTISLGFFASLFVGSVLGFFGYYKPAFHRFFDPAMNVLRLTPMATLIVMAMLWSTKSILAFEICFMLALPVMYQATVSGLVHARKRYLHMAHEMHLTFWKKLNYIYRPASMPEYVSGCHRAINMCCKSGTIVHVVGDSVRSVGERFYFAKDSKDVAEIFAFTIVMIFLSYFFEFLVIKILRKVTVK